MGRLSIVLAALLTLGTSATAAEPKSKEFGALTGRFVFDGDLPKAKLLVVDKDKVVCGGDKPDESLLVDAKSRGIANVVIELVDKKRPKHPEWEKKIATPVEMQMQSCQFKPRLCVILVGQTWTLTNLDSVGHNPKRDLRNNPLDSFSYPQKYSVPTRFKFAEPLPASISCAIHPWMQGYLVICDHPYVAVTNATGKFTIPDLPPGEWTFRVWHEKPKLVKSVQRTGKEELWPKGRFTVTINPGENDLGDIYIPAQAFTKTSSP